MVDHQIKETKKLPRNKCPTVCAVLTSMASILMGYDIRAMSGAGMYIKEDLKIYDVKLEIMPGMINLCVPGWLPMAGKTSNLVFVNLGLVGTTFISLEHAVTTEGAFFIFTGFTTISVMLYYLILPETLGRTLEETESLFGIFTGWRTTAKELEMKKKAEKVEQV